MRLYRELPEGSIFFHEDDYLQVEILPNKNLFVENKMNAQNSFNDSGIVEIFSRSQIMYPLQSLQIGKESMESVLKKYAIFSFNFVYSGYSNHRERVDNAFGFGYENHAIIYKHDGYKFQVVNMWIIYSYFSDEFNRDPQALKATLEDLGLTYEVMLVDWIQNIALDLKNKKSVDSYLKDL